MNNKSNTIKLNLPDYHFRFAKKNGKNCIFDEIRKKFVVLNPEEWVRQNFIQFLLDKKKYPSSLMAVEKKVEINHQPQRFDLLIYDRNGNPLVMAEFKSPEVRITQDAFNQVVRYNMVLKVKYIFVSNGLQHFACLIDYQNNSFRFLEEIPEYGLEKKSEGLK